MQFVIGKGSECAKGDACLLLENRAERESSDMCPADVLILVGVERHVDCRHNWIKDHELSLDRTDALP